MIDDQYRPVDDNGNIIEQTNSELSITINNYNYAWYFSVQCYWNKHTPNLDTTLRVYNHLLPTGAIPSVTPTVRFIIQISTDDFATITHEKIINTTTGPNYVNIYAKSDVSSARSIRRTYGNSGNLLGYDSLSISLASTQYKIRCKAQYKINNTWQDIVRSGNKVWKTCTSYAPFYQSITPPAHFYANRVNIFDTNIGSDYKYQYSTARLYSGTYTYSNVNRIVRSVDPPYLTTGIATQHLYWYPGLHVGEEHPADTYYFNISLSISDPSDSENDIIVAERTVTGPVEYYDTDDTSSMYGTFLLSINDPTGMYETYNALLRNITSEVQIVVQTAGKYGVKFTLYCDYRSATGIPQVIMPIDETVSTISSIPLSLSNLPSTTYIHVTVVSGEYRHQYRLDDLSVINYAIPTLSETSVHRCDSDGTANDNGDHCRIDWAVAITSINNQNSKKLTIRHPEGTTEFDPLDSYTQGGSIVVAANPNYAYDIVFTISDDFKETTKSIKLSTANVIMDWLYNGKAVSFGKVANIPNSVEISDAWKFICYNLMIGNLDINKWIQQLESRIGALEQFAGNLGSTNQFQVSFFNFDGTELLKRDWVNLNALPIPPSVEPDQEPTERTVYAFAGWALDDHKSSANPASLDPVTAHRDIYAAFTQTERKYIVQYYNETQVISTIQDVTYGANTSNPGSVSKSGYTFWGWMPSGKRILGNTDAKAQFFKNTEITDSWSDIMKTVNDKTALTKYEIGQYKTLNCGIYGSVKMRIVGFKIDHALHTDKKILISWEADDCLPTLRRMSPALEYTTEERGTDDWAQYKSIWNGYYRYQSTFHRYPKHTGNLHVNVKCATSGTFSIGYYTNRTSSDGEGEGNIVTIKVNNVTKFSGNPGINEEKTIDYSASVGSEYSIDITYKSGNSINANLLTINLHIPGMSTESTEEVTYTTSQYITLYPRSYTDGTGSHSGWAKSELRTFLNNDFFNQIDPNVRNNIKTVGKISRSAQYNETLNSKCESVSNEESGDKVFIPSMQEMSGNRDYETLGVDFLKYRRYKYGNGRTGSGQIPYWTRTANIASSNLITDEDVINYTYMPTKYYYINASGSENTDNAENEKGVCICFCT